MTIEHNDMDRNVAGTLPGKVDMRRSSDNSLDDEFDDLIDIVEPSGETYLSGWRLMVRSLRENRVAMVGIGLIVLLVLFCFVGPVIYPTNQVTTVITRSNLPPSSSFPLGTDNDGFNILGRLMVGGQLSLEVGISVAMIATVFGALWGAIAGWFGGIVDAVMMRIVDTLLAIPWIFLFLFLTSVTKPSVGLIIGVLSLLSWLIPARLARAETLSLRNRDFVEATRMLGGTGRRIVIRHIIPNAMGVIVVNATLQVADSILALALLSYLGFGPPPPTASWGGMLSNGINFLFDGYWWAVYPVAILIILTIVAFNFLGDGIRDALEVRLTQR